MNIIFVFNIYIQQLLIDISNNFELITHAHTPPTHFLI